jgi:hypothetical protein
VLLITRKPKAPSADFFQSGSPGFVLETCPENDAYFFVGERPAVLSRLNFSGHVHLDVGKRVLAMNSRSRRASEIGREAQKAFKQPKGEKALSEYEQDGNASREDLRRLRAERMLRQSTTGHAASKKGN